MNCVMSQLKHPLTAGIFILSSLLPTAGLCYTSPETITGSQKIDAVGLIELVNRFENLLIIDSRISSDRKLGYIPGSTSLPDTETNCESLARVIPARTDPVVFYCNGPRCRRSDNAVAIAASCGYTNIYWFRGGIEAWRANNYPINK